MLYIGPVLFICIGYLRIGRSLLNTDSTLFAGRTSINSGAGNAAEKNICSRRKVAKMLYVIALLFALSWLPYNVMAVSLDFLPTEFVNTHGELLGYIFVYCTWLGHCNSSINPICYCIMSQSFKHALKKDLTSGCCLKRLQRKCTAQSTNSYAGCISMTTQINEQQQPRATIDTPRSKRMRSVNYKPMTHDDNGNCSNAEL